MKAISRFLVALMIWAPYQFATAGMIGTDQASANAERATLVSQLKAYGVEAAEDRIAALSDEEARTLAREIATAPAGGVYGEGIVFIILVALIAYAWYKHRNPW